MLDSLLASIKIFTVGKNCHYPLTTTQGDRFASCENIVSCRQDLVSSPLPPRFFVSLRFKVQVTGVQLSLHILKMLQLKHCMCRKHLSTFQKNNPNRNSRAIFSKVIIQSNFDFALSSEGKDFAS